MNMHPNYLSSYSKKRSFPCFQVLLQFQKLLSVRVEIIHHYHWLLHLWSRLRRVVRNGNHRSFINSAYIRKISQSFADRLCSVQLFFFHDGILERCLSRLFFSCLVQIDVPTESNRRFRSQWMRVKGQPLRVQIYRYFCPCGEIKGRGIDGLYLLKGAFAGHSFEGHFFFFD